MKPIERWVVVLVVVHLVVLVFHTGAHVAVSVAIPGALDSAFILLVFYVLPIASVVLLRSRATLGGFVFLTSMALSFGYGCASHYLLPGPDNVGSVAANGWGPLFHVTTAALAVLEGIGIALGVLFLVARRSGRSSAAGTEAGAVPPANFGIAPVECYRKL